MRTSISILFLAAEAEPFIKIGGLADVAGSLPLAMRALPNRKTGGILLDVALALPLHSVIRQDGLGLHLIMEYSIPHGSSSIPVQVFQTSLRGMPVYFFSGSLFSTGGKVYSGDPAEDRRKYTYFCLAVFEFLRRMDKPVDIVHANDWHTSLVLYALRSLPENDPRSQVRKVLSVHNLPYMGGDASDTLSAFGLLPVRDELLPKWALTQPLPLGLWSADAIIPVSPTYAREILTPEYGCDLDPFLRAHSDRITGILNGIDVDTWDPGRDEILNQKFNSHSMQMRSANKIALQKELELPVDHSIPLIISIGRVDWQKGLDLAYAALRQKIGYSWQFILLGTGDPVLESEARALQTEYPNRVRAVIRFDAGLSRRMYAGADLILMPSRYEPCGLAQMIAMRYGCLPLVRATGGLKDSVRDGETGFIFQDATNISLADGIQRALDLYSQPALWENSQRKAMNEDFSWQRSAQQYANIYLSLSPIQKSLI